jgi:nitroreductase
MEVLQAIKTRYSVRSYKPDPISDEVISILLDAARLAPSASNYQPWRFIVVKDKKKKDRMARSGFYGRFLNQAPVVIVACGDTKSKYYIHDTCIALEHIVLAAWGKGLGTCWVVSFNEDLVREMLKIPRRFRIVALLPIGYPKQDRDFLGSFLHFVRPRKKLGDIVFLEEYYNPHHTVNATKNSDIN